MKLKIYIIIGALCIIVLILIGISLRANKASNNNPSSTVPIPTQNAGQITPNPIANTLRAVDTFPSDKQTNTGLDQRVIITFNKNISSKEVIFSMNPNVPNTSSITNNQLTITFSSPLSYSTIYTYTLKYLNYTYSQSFSFSTATQASAVNQDNAAELNKLFTRQTRPDIFLYNQIAYTDPNFSLSGDFTSTPTNHYYITVTLINSDKDKAKQSFLSWLNTLGLTDQQVQTLDIRYQ